MKKIAVLATLSLTASAALATDFDFESVPVGPLAGDTLVLTSQGVNVTFSANALQIRDFGGNFGNAGHVLSSWDDAGPITAVFSQAVQSVSFENIINGRYSSEVDFIDGWAYDAGNNLVDSVSGSSADFLTLSGAGIVRVVWQEANVGGGFVVDNVSFVIPAPGSLALVGFGGLFARRRRA